MKAPDFLSQLGVDSDEFTVNYDDYDVVVESESNEDTEFGIGKIEFDHTFRKIIIRTD